MINQYYIGNYQWKLFKPDFFYFKTETIRNNDFDIFRVNLKILKNLHGD